MLLSLNTTKTGSGTEYRAVCDANGYLTVVVAAGSALLGTVKLQNNAGDTITGVSGTFDTLDVSLTNGTYRVTVDANGYLTVNAVQSGTWNIGTVTTLTNPVFLKNAAADTITGISGTYDTLDVSLTNGTNRTTVDANGYLTVNAVQSGTWNITNISGTISLPTGASTSGNQTTMITALQLIDDIYDTIYTDGVGTPTKGILIMGTDGTNPQAIAVDASGNLKLTANVSVNLDYTEDEVMVYGSQNVPLQQKVTTNDLIVTLDGEIPAVTQSGTWNIGTVTTLTTLTNPVFLKNAASDTITGVSGTYDSLDISLIDSTGAYRAEVDSSGHLLVHIYDDQDHSPTLVKEEDTFSASAYGYPMYGADDTAPARKWRAIRVNDDGHLVTHVHNLAEDELTGITGANYNTIDISVSDGTDRLAIDGSGNIAVTQSGTWNVGTVTTVTTVSTLTTVTNPIFLKNAASDTITGISGTYDTLDVSITNGTNRTTVDANGYLTVNAVQSGTWNITNISGTISLPTGAATEASVQGIENCTSTVGTARMLIGDAGSIINLDASGNVSCIQSGTWNVGTVTTVTTVSTLTTVTNPVFLKNAASDTITGISSTYDTLDVSITNGTTRLDVVASPYENVTTENSLVSLSVVHGEDLDVGATNSEPIKVRTEDDLLPYSEKHLVVVGLLYGDNGSNWERIKTDGSGNLKVCTP